MTSFYVYGCTRGYFPLQTNAFAQHHFQHVPFKNLYHLRRFCRLTSSQHSPSAFCFPLFDQSASSDTFPRVNVKNIIIIIIIIQHVKDVLSANSCKKWVCNLPAKQKKKEGKKSPRCISLMVSLGFIAIF